MVCGRGIIENSYAVDAMPNGWTEWVDRFQPVITPNSISFSGFTFGCDPDWYYVEAPTLDELMSAFYRQGTSVARSYPVAVWGYGANSSHKFAHPALGLPAPSLVVNTLPFQDSLGYGTGVVIPLESPLTPVVYDIFQNGQSRATQGPRRAR